MRTCLYGNKQQFSLFASKMVQCIYQLELMTFCHESEFSVRLVNACYFEGLPLKRLVCYPLILPSALRKTDGGSCGLIACCSYAKGKLRLLNYNLNTIPTLMTSRWHAVNTILHNHSPHKTPYYQNMYISHK